MYRFYDCCYRHLLSRWLLLFLLLLLCKSFPELLQLIFHFHNIRCNF